MANISPVSDLRNYNTVLEKVAVGSPLYYQDSFTGYYFVMFKAHLTFYRLEDDVMLIDRILFGRSDYIRCLHLGTDEES